MYDYKIHSDISKFARKNNLEKKDRNDIFYARLIANVASIHSLYSDLYGQHSNGKKIFRELLNTIMCAFISRSKKLKKEDEQKLKKGHWFLSNKLAGMSLYVDRFAGSIAGLEDKLDYFKDLGVNVLHLMPLFESPEGERDGGYAVSNCRKVDKRFGKLKDFQNLQKKNVGERFIPAT